tara:strand:+ start:6513 stop:7559 length:1047 start_codon:yes stop_codon:yes gene_type:complete
MYRTRLGLDAMDKYAKKHPRFFNIFALFSIIIGFIGMVFIFESILVSAYKILLNPTISEQGARLLLPGFQFPGLPRLSFFHWIIAIFVLAVVHEFSHGVIARLYNVKVKSSGFAVLGIVLPIFPAAFVEPDEEQLSQKSRKAQLGVLAAGSFSNLILSGILFLVFFFIFTPITASLVEFDGIIITNLEDNNPAKNSGLKIGEKVIEVNDNKIEELDDFSKEIKNLKPGDELKIKTNESSYNLVATTHPKIEDKGYLGLSYGINNIGYAIKTYLWFNLLIYWLFVINLLVGLINLFPMFITDGAKMLHVGLSKFIRNDTILKKLWGMINLFCVLLLLINFLPPIIGWLS